MFRIRRNSRSLKFLLLLVFAWIIFAFCLVNNSHGDLKQTVMSKLRYFSELDLQFLGVNHIQASHKKTQKIKPFYQATEKPTKIHQYIWEHVNILAQNDKFQLPDCSFRKPQMNFNFIKTHKCASDTLSAMFRHFSLDNNLSVALPLGKKYLLGWPHKLEKIRYRPPVFEKHNIFLDHAIFDYEHLSSVMPNDTIHITTVREPFSRLNSALNFFAFRERTFMQNEDDVLMRFLENMDYYDKLYTSDDHVTLHMSDCVPPGVSIAKNAMAFDMGFPTGYHLNTTDQSNNYTFIKEWLNQIQNNVSLFIVVEYFHESLILLKRYFCWEWKNVFYVTVNQGFHYKQERYSLSSIDRFLQWSNVDTLIYHMANKTFWKRISSLGEDFRNEVLKFENHLEIVNNYCRNKISIYPLQMPETAWNPSYVINREYCDRMFDQDHLRDDLRNAYDAKSEVNYTAKSVGSRLYWC